MSLKTYRAKRNFRSSPEPSGKALKHTKGPLRFVVQMHRASRLHYDFRLEFGGVLKSWAVPKGPSLNPLDQRLAVLVEDHPLAYGAFEGVIPEGNYGAGTVMIWDEGTYEERTPSSSRKQMEEKMVSGFAKGHITFLLQGQKLNGEFALIKLKKDASDKAWLLVKKRDEHASYKRNEAFANVSAKSGRTLDDIASQAKAQGEIWLPKRKKPSAKEAASTKAASATAKSFAKPAKRFGAKREVMPRKNRPMLATSGKLPTDESEKNWIFEINWGGRRAISEIEGRRVHLYSKSGLPFEGRFPEIIKELKDQPFPMVLDGEITESKGRPIYHVFDIIYLDGQDLRKTDLKDRKVALIKALKEGPCVRLTPTQGAPMDTDKRKRGSHGPNGEAAIIAKNKHSPYRPGTTKDWILLSPHDQAPGSNASDELRLTHVDKIYWPEEKITKGDLINYYRQMAAHVIPYLVDRPESLNRYPDGIAAQGFYQKDMTGHLPRWFKTTRIYSESSEKSINYALCQDERSLLYLVNLGCIEMNPWFSRVSHLDQPDFLVIDLDPDGNEFKHVVEVAQEVHRILDSIGATNVCKTSGATGIHIGVPTGAKYSFGTVRELAEGVCRIVAQKFPTTTSMDRNPNRRRKKIYLDCLQNRRGQTLASPFSVRPRAGAPVSMPLTWDQLTAKIKPEQFNITNAFSRVKKYGDPWKTVLGSAVNLEKCLRQLAMKSRS